MKTFALLSVICLAAPSARAADSTPEIQNAARMVAVTTCANCHGPHGQAIAPKFPKLAGQNASYLAAQMKAFKMHARADSDAVAYMWGMAAPLDDNLIEALASYYAGQSAGRGERVDGAASARGRVIYEQGVPAAGVPACATCHGQDAAGKGDFPQLAGQSSQYLIKQLRAFHTNLRDVAVMHGVTMALSDSDMRDIAAYLAGLRR